MSDWKNVQYKDGKYRTSEEGGGGSSTFAGLDDVSFNDIQNGQVPKYNSETHKWENANESGGGGTVTDVTVDGVSVVNQQGVAEIEMPTPPTIPVENVEVNGESVVNAQKVAEIKSYKEVTQSEYNALPASKTSDDILYCIKDSAGADGFPPLIYSDEEREIGVWRDGKPLYQKTLVYTPSALNQDIDMSALSIDTVVEFSGSFVRAMGSPYGNYDYPIMGRTEGSAYNQYGLSYRYQETSKVLNIIIGGYSLADIISVRMTIRYTKTTDSAGSGTWTTQGGYAHHYSTNEKVIGTWIDGKPLYEKTINIASITNDATYDVSSLNIDKMINNVGFGNGNGTYATLCFPLQFANPYGNNLQLSFYYDSNAKLLRFNIGSVFAPILNAYITLQYTKTTD